jgi:thioredoxin reductase
VRDSFDCVVVGDGVAGLSAALVLGRARRKTLVLGAGEPRNAPARKMHGFFSREGTNPQELLVIARSQLAPYDAVSIEDHRVVDLKGSLGHFVTHTAAGETFHSKRILLATGVRDVLPKVEGVHELWGTRLFTCPYCDGWEFCDRRIAVSGPGSEAIGLARELFRWSEDLIVCLTDRSEPAPEDRTWLERHKPHVVSGDIARFSQAGAAVRIELTDGSHVESDVVFLSAPLRQRSSLPEALGCKLEDDGRIAIDECGRTNVAGVYAAGDAANRRHQVVLAAAGGASAAMTINEDFIEAER